MFRKQNLTFLIGALTLGIAVIIGAVPAETGEPEAARNTTTRVVRVDLVEATAGGREVRLPAVTRSTARAALAFTIPARVESRMVEIGDRVRAGQILARLDESEYALANRSAEAALAELDVRLEQAKRDEARVAQLVGAKAATTEELEKTRAGTETLVAAREAAAAQVAATRRLVDETVLRSPFDGTVTAVEIEPGEWASPGSTVVELSGSDKVEVRIEVPEAMVGRIEAASRVRVELPMSGRSVEGRITSVSGAAGGPGSLFPVIVGLEASDGVVAGLAAEVVIPLTMSSELTVPLAAVLDSGSNRPSVFVVKDGVARRVTIRPGQVVGDRLTVASGDIAAGDTVAVLGHTALVDGDRVEVR